jgi:hypothetical protein
MSTFITEKTKSIRTIRAGDLKFKIPAGIMMSDRASIEIDPVCPNRYSSIILEAYSKGWIRPVAHVTEREYILLGLSTD